MKQLKIVKDAKRLTKHHHPLMLFFSTNLVVTETRDFHFGQNTDLCLCLFGRWSSNVVTSASRAVAWLSVWSFFACCFCLYVLKKKAQLYLQSYALVWFVFRVFPG